MRRRFATEVRNVFDTQIAAGFAGLGAQSSYDTLLAELLDVRLAKSASFTRWDTRPLSRRAARQYAREDVVHLLALAAELERRLTALGRLEWAREECQLRSSTSATSATSTRCSRACRGFAASSPAAQTIARELVDWRERTAAAADRPVQSILGDAPLVEIAKRKPSSTRQLEQIRGVNAGEPAPPRARSCSTPCTAAANGRRIPCPRRAARRQPDPDDGPLIALAEAFVRAARPRGRPRLRAARRARRPAGDRRRPARRRSRGRRAHAARLAARARRLRAARAARRPRVAVRQTTG